jgi:hypothetical protein
MEVAVARKALRQQFGANDLTILENQAAACLVRKKHAGNARDQQWITQAYQYNGDKSKAD